jgi:hypothetical protein
VDHLLTHKKELNMNEVKQVPIWTEVGKGLWQVALPPNFGSLHGNILRFPARSQEHAQEQLDSRMEALAANEV